MTDIYKKDRKKEKNWNYTRGGDGSHWEGCEESHWDCKIVHLEKQVERMEDAVEEAERMLRIYLEDHPNTTLLVREWLKEYAMETKMNEKEKKSFEKTISKDLKIFNELESKVERMEEVVKAAMRWDIADGWVHTEKCGCERCGLVRACDKYAESE